VPDLLGGHGRGPAEAHAAGAGGIQSFAGALDDQLADELRQRGEDMEDQPELSPMRRRTFDLPCRLSPEPSSPTR